FELAGRRLWTALGQPPALFQVPSMLPQSLHEREGWRRAAHENSHGRQFPSAGIVIQAFQNAVPDRGYARGNGDTLLFAKLQQALRLEVRTGQNLFRSH